MKKLKIVLVLLTVVLFLPIIKTMAQAIDPPTDIVDLVSNFDTFLGSILGFAAVSIFLTGLINGWSKITESWIKQIVSWVVPIVLILVVSAILNMGFLAGESVLKLLIYGLGTGLLANGVFDINFVNMAISWIVPKLGGITKKEE